MHSVWVKTKCHFLVLFFELSGQVDVVFSMESFDCSLCWPGHSNISAEPHWQRGRFRSYALNTVCFVSWIAAFHWELHQLLDLMDLTLTQGFRLSQRKILKRFDSVCNLIIEVLAKAIPQTSMEEGTQAGVLGVGFFVLFLTRGIFLRKCF